MSDFLTLLMKAEEMNASDLHLSAHAPAAFRLRGDLVADGDVLLPEEVDQMACAVMTERQRQTFAACGEVDFAFHPGGGMRCRVNVYRQRGCTSMAIRFIPRQIPKFATLGLPDAVLTLVAKPHGLVLVTGRTGSGKSTTLASLIDHVNHTQRRHIITLEDPVEYVHSNTKSIVDQREVGTDTRSFATGLRAALRQDPDIIMVGELRDLETIRVALTAAETGHLVLATLHTSNAVQTIERIIDVYPSAQQAQVRVQLASVLQGIVCQRLVPARSSNGRVAVVELLLNTPAVANLIRSDANHQIPSVMQTSRASGMLTMDAHVRELALRGLIGLDAAAAPVV